VACARAKKGGVPPPEKSVDSVGRRVYFSHLLSRAFAVSAVAFEGFCSGRSVAKKPSLYFTNLLQVTDSDVSEGSFVSVFPPFTLVS
jgi:hypothetical protein